MKKIILLAIFFGCLSIGNSRASLSDPIAPGENLEVTKESSIKISGNLVLNSGEINIRKGGNLIFCGKFIAIGDWIVVVTDGQGKEIYDLGTICIEEDLQE